LRQELPHSVYVEVADLELKLSEAGTRGRVGRAPEAGTRGRVGRAPETGSPGHAGKQTVAVFENPGKQVLWARAFIVTERESQKGMIVGKDGQMIKAIRLAALKELKKIFDWKIDLDLRVKTGKDWRHDDRILKKMTGCL